MSTSPDYKRNSVKRQLQLGVSFPPIFPLWGNHYTANITQRGDYIKHAITQTVVI